MDGPPANFEVKGVVLNGRVVLDVPLDAPDGTLVMIYRYEDDDRDETTQESLRDRVRKLYQLVDLFDVKLRGLEKKVKVTSGQEAA
jgi:hypothetical protein